MPEQLDRYTQDYLQETRKSLEKIAVNMFLCGSGVAATRRPHNRRNRPDIRSFLKKKINSELTRCDVKLGEHRQLIQAFKTAAGREAANLADHELSLARRKKMDLIIIFPCSPGSFAELGMFSIIEKVAPKMVIFLNRKYRRKGSYLRHGPVKAAVLRSARVFVVDYRNRNCIWDRVKQLVLEQKAKKRGTKLLTT